VAVVSIREGEGEGRAKRTTGAYSSILPRNSFNEASFRLGGGPFEEEVGCCC
jgi:hypothetical protein